ncbi:efflux transporter periplasmic adaptor subunit [Xanthomonas arboricola]|uniref:efflux RND transporter periplasmic adaptor subunit n=1 Tax=Xanthomonas arboricola TaxID=56448 RepID=UPI000CEE571E|nr:efflux RND transporter periplasmic adaptor subunit [Xanthomonas arboricola]PPU44935.1 efflux transporter periplasmic adaptor subunit [Xanthomonas arboricola]
MTPEPSALRRHLLLIVVLCIALTIVIFGLSSRWTHAQALRERAQERSDPVVKLISPTPVDAASVDLPGRIEAWSRAPIYARASGYLKSWSVDIGQAVKAGQTLAEIETPDLDQQLAQARSEVGSLRSQANQAEATANRWKLLLESRAVARQDAEERIAAAQAQQSQVEALQANVQRLQTLQGFRRLVAPFDGIVTARNTDIGALINDGMSAGSELFVVSDVHRLRVYVNVPQRQISAIQIGAKAQLSVPEHPGKTYEATVLSLAQAIDSASGAMRVQLIVDNPNGELLPGSYATVRFAPAQRVFGLGLPPSALILGKDGVQVATLSENSQVRLLSVSISRDYGRMVALEGELTTTMRVIDSPPDGISNGDRVRAVENKDSDAAAPESSSGTVSAAGTWKRPLQYVEQDNPVRPDIMPTSTSGVSRRR